MRDWNWNVPSPLPMSTEMSSESMLAVTRSALPSRLKSPTARETGPIPAG